MVSSGFDDLIYSYTWSGSYYFIIIFSSVQEILEHVSVMLNTIIVIIMNWLFIICVTIIMKMKITIVIFDLIYNWWYDGS